MRLSLPLLLACSLIAAPLPAQPRAVAPGDVVRFSPGPRGVYTVQQVGADSLTVSRGTEEVRVPAQGIAIRRAHGRNHVGGLLRGAAFGLAAGTVLGGVSGYAQGDTNDGWFNFTAAENAAIGAVVLGSLGLVTGGALGLMFPPHDWELASVAAARAAFSPAAPDGRPGLVLTINF